MGWWETGDGSIVGDVVLDVLGAATDEVTAHYKENWKRSPTIGEWQQLVGKALLAHLVARPEVIQRDNMLFAEAPAQKVVVTIEVVKVQ